MKILVVGVGGQGILLFSRILGEAALSAGTEVIMSEVHGMAQRGGVVESSIVIGGKRSPFVSRGEADVLVALEPVEALRALDRCSASTVAVVSSDPVVPQVVKDGLATYPEVSPLLERLKEVLAEVHIVAGQKLAREAGSSKALNLVMLGALSETGLLPFPKDFLVEAIKRTVKPKFLELNLKAFQLGAEAVRS